MWGFGKKNACWRRLGFHDRIRERILDKRQAGTMSRRNRNWIRIGLLVSGGLLMGAGIARGEMAEVFLKATRICLECVGIG